MSFGEKGIEQKHWSETNLEIAFNRMQEAAPVFGEGGDTYERDGKYFVMGVEVLEPQYNAFMEKFEQVSGKVIDQKNEELDRMAA